MVCSAYLDAMKEADPAALRGEGETALASHIRTCARCRTAAARVLRADARLAAWLGSAPLAVSEAARPGQMHSRAQATGNARQKSDAARFGSARRGRVRRVVRKALPIAALIALVVAIDQGVERVTRVAPPDTAQASAPDAVLETPDVDVQPGQNAVVFRTSNPKITVVWYYSEGAP